MTGCDFCGVGPDDECSMDCPSRLEEPERLVGMVCPLCSTDAERRVPFIDRPPKITGGTLGQGVTDDFGGFHDAPQYEALEVGMIGGQPAHIDGSGGAGTMEP